MLYFAYDGSIHGDWVSHYATRLAANHEEHSLHLVHVCEQQRKTSERELQENITRIDRECQRLGVKLQSRIVSVAGSVLATIRAATASGPDNFLVCGTRVRGRQRGWLSGTVSERLLSLGHCNVLAVRVAQPGLLGCPRRLLVPVSGHPRGFRSGLPFLKLLAPDLVQMHILFVRPLTHWRFRTLSCAAADQLRQPGEAYCLRVEQEIIEQLGEMPRIVDANAIISDDVPKEIVIAANKTKSRLIYLGASEKNLTEQFFYGNPVEQVLRDATCDVAIYRGVQ